MAENLYEGIKIVDTNVLLKDPSAITLMASEGDKIVVSTVLLEELDKFKHETGNRGRNARRASRNLKDLLQLGGNGTPDSFLTGINIGDKGGKVYGERHFLENISHDTLRNYTRDLNSDNPDIRFIQLALHIQKSKQVTPKIVTGDIIANLLSRQYGLDVLEWKVRDEIYRGFRTTTNPGLFKIFSDEHFLDPKQVYDAVIEDYAEEDFFEWWMPNEYVSIRTNEGDSLGKGALVLRYDFSQDRFIETKKPPGHIKPRNDLQKAALDAVLTPEIQHVFLIGSAGTAKTFFATYGAYLQAVRNIGGSNRYDCALITRPLSGTDNDLGSLPGDEIDKLSPWLAPIHDNLRAIAKEMKKEGGGIKGLYSSFKTFNLSGQLEPNSWYVQTLDCIRGRSLHGIYTIVDEAQNASEEAILATATRVGCGGKIVYTGDPRQSDRATTKFSNPLVQKSIKYAPLESTAVINFPFDYCERDESVRRILELEEN